MSASLLILRLVLGTAMAAHGAQKLFGWFGGYGLKGTGGYMESLGFRPGVRFALAAGLTEFAGGLLFATGLLGPIGPALMLSVMLVAILTVHKSHGFFAMTNGIELPVLYITGALAVAFTGPGRFSLDHVLGLSGYFDQTIVWVALVAGVLGALANLSVRHLPEPVSKAA
jgi:putative oxidoreductase